MPEADSSLMLTILKDLQKDMPEHRTMLLQLVEGVRRNDRRFDEIERRISDARADLELMLKAELLGRLTHFETLTDERIAQLEDRLSVIEGQHN